MERNVCHKELLTLIEQLIESTSPYYVDFYTSIEYYKSKNILKKSLKFSYFNIGQKIFGHLKTISMEATCSNASSISSILFEVNN